MLLLRPMLSLTLAGLLAGAAEAHYNMLLPETTSAQKGKPVTFLYQWGHPFEHQLFEAPPPQSVVAVAPDGGKTDLTANLEKISVPAGDHKVAAYRFSFAPEQRGDYLVVLTTPPIWMPDEEQFFQDTVKVVLHVQAQRGWDAVGRQDFEMVPYTRPYGLQPGVVFQVQALFGGKPLAGELLEVEHYHPEAPKELPPDEQITRTVKTDPNGIGSGTLTDPGWWCVTVQHDGGTRDHEGKPHPVLRRSTFWVFVDEKTAPK